ncbi:MAG: 4Fe-4S binding protein, partial [Candidatus Omnitrophica bacterium]|nr:4Fe-4S binding protein [Candidatus Omnitrophota bacterium]
DPKQVVFTNQARCRDCYRCVRVCPVKAIRIEGGQAFVDAKRCISCGTCVRECPQGAKTYRKDIEKAQQVLTNNKFVAVSLAPSFAGAYEPWQYLRLPAALRRLGFKHVAETAVGAYKVACATTPVITKNDQTYICTACPAVVHYIEKYDQEKLGNLLPVVSPMIAHAKHIKTKYGLEAKVIFIGPCVAKKMEADRREFNGLIDCVLTFDELNEWLKGSHIDLGTCEESSFDEIPAGNSRLFPVEGGALATSSLETNLIDDRLIFVSGFEEIRNVLNTIPRLEKPCVIEPLICPHGCVNGAGMDKEGNVFDRRAKIIKYARTNKPGEPLPEPPLDLTTSFKAQSSGAEVHVNEEDIRVVLEKTGKARKEDQLNCGACGYSSCRDQAVAVVLHMAETDMCIPYMRRLAEQRSDRIIATSPNGIVVLNQALQILNVNPAFLKMFHANESCVGKSISSLVDPDPFEKVVSGQIETFDSVCVHKSVKLVTRQLIYALHAEKQFVGIFISMTPGKVNAERLEKIQDETIQQAEELYQHQIEMAKNFANFLGEYTAKGEQLVQKLMDAVKEEKPPKSP